MKVVHLSTNLSDSSACMKLHKAMIDCGIESKIITMRYTGKYKPAEIIEVGKGTLISRVLRKAEQEIDKCVLADNRYPYNSDKFGFYNTIIHIQELLDADIIHLHWICGFVSISDVKRLSLLNKPIVWTFHDIWPLTGGCHIFLNDCKKYLGSCDKCQFIKAGVNTPQNVLEEKKKVFPDCTIHVITPSDWLTSLAKESNLFSSSSITTIPNVLENADRYKKSNQECIEILQERYKEFDNDYINVLYVSTSTELPYKGYKYFEDLLGKILDEKQLAGHIKVHVVGEAKKESEIIQKYKHTIWGYIKDNEYLSCIYSCCDFLINPSLADNFPSVVCESLACATPVLTFETGGIPSMIDHKKSGYIAKYADGKDLFDGFMWLINADKDKLGTYGRDKVVGMCSGKQVVSQHIELYEKII